MNKVLTSSSNGLLKLCALCVFASQIFTQSPPSLKSPLTKRYA